MPEQVAHLHFVYDNELVKFRILKCIYGCFRISRALFLYTAAGQSQDTAVQQRLYAESYEVLH